jgi:hypothetical protein
MIDGEDDDPIQFNVEINSVWKSIASNPTDSLSNLRDAFRPFSTDLDRCHHLGSEIFA